MRIPTHEIGEPMLGGAPNPCARPFVCLHVCVYAHNVIFYLADYMSVNMCT
jgi:hypothetical protein